MKRKFLIGEESLVYCPEDHTFVLCAYESSPYLEDCIKSLKAQETLTKILVATSTPNNNIEKVCKDNNLPLYVHCGGKGGIADDWNYAISCASTPLVTVAHQDDIYLPDYATRMLKRFNCSQHPLIYFTNYGELREGARIDDNALLNIKRVLLKPLEKRWLENSRFLRRRVLSFGSPICCPSVTFAMDSMPIPIFNENMKCSLDWDAWERLSGLRGDFLYDSKILMLHRIHEESETTALIQDNTRGREDCQMFKRLWPAPIAWLLGRAYSISQRSNG